MASEAFADLSVLTEDLHAEWDKQHVCPFVDICLSLYVCVGLSWVGSRLKFCLRCCGPPNGKVLTLPSSSLPRPLLTYIHTHKLGVGMICRFRCSATLLPILASFRHRQHFLPLSSTPGRDMEEGGMKREEIRKMLASHNLSRFITLSSKVQISYMCKLVKLQVAVSLSLKKKKSMGENDRKQNRKTFFASGKERKLETKRSLGKFAQTVNNFLLYCSFKKRVDFFEAQA